MYYSLHFKSNSRRLLPIERNYKCGGALARKYVQSNNKRVIWNALTIIIGISAHTPTRSSFGRFSFYTSSCDGNDEMGLIFMYCTTHFYTKDAKTIVITTLSPFITNLNVLKPTQL